jgi:hypothetical protein
MVAAEKKPCMEQKKCMFAQTHGMIAIHARDLVN